MNLIARFTTFRPLLSSLAFATALATTGLVATSASAQPMPDYPGDDAGDFEDDPGYPGADMPGYPGGQMPGYPGGQMPGYPGAEMPGYPGGQMPGYPGAEMPGYPGGQMPGYPGGQMPGYPGAEMPGYPGGQMPGYPGGQMPGYPGGQMPGAQVPPMPTTPGYPGGPTPGQPGAQVPGYPGGAQAPSYPTGPQGPAYPGARNPGAQPQTGAVIVNGVRLDPARMAQLGMQPGSVPAGNYWYDAASGLWGHVGSGSEGQITPGLALGPMDPGCSNGRTGVFMNGRQITAYEAQIVGQFYGRLAPGRYRLDAQGNVTPERGA